LHNKQTGERTRERRKRRKRRKRRGNLKRKKKSSRSIRRKGKRGRKDDHRLFHPRRGNHPPGPRYAANQLILRLFTIFGHSGSIESSKARRTRGDRL